MITRHKILIYAKHVVMKLIVVATAWDPIPCRLDPLIRLHEGPRRCISKDTNKHSVCVGGTTYLVLISSLHGLETVKKVR